MGDYLRDTKLSFLTIGETELEEIDGDLKEILARVNQAAPQDDLSNLSYVLRYDGMGIIRRDFEEIKRSFNRAKKVERIFFQFTSPKNNQNKGKNIQINLDAQLPLNCFLVVSDDDEAWVDSNFGRLKGRLDHYQNSNWVAHSPLAELFVQLLGVFFGFSLCLICANLISPLVTIKYAFVILFVGFFLVFLNLWTYMLMLLGKGRNYFWQYVSFKKKPIGKIGQTVIAFFITLVLSRLLQVSWKILKGIATIVPK